MCQEAFLKQFYRFDLEVLQVYLCTNGRLCHQGNKPWVSLPRGKGIRLTIAEERDKRLAAKQSSS